MMPTPINEKHTFTNELENLLNKHSIDNDLNTPDFLLADMIVQMLEAIRITRVKTADWQNSVSTPCPDIVAGTGVVAVDTSKL